MSTLCGSGSIWWGPSIPLIRFSNPEVFDSGNFDIFYAYSLFWFLPMSRLRRWSLGFGLSLSAPSSLWWDFPCHLGRPTSACSFTWMPFTCISACWRPIHVLRPSASPTSPRMCVLGFLLLAGFWVWREEGGFWSQAHHPHLPPRVGRWDELILRQGRDSVMRSLLW